jgi:hypothetical protein
MTAGQVQCRCADLPPGWPKCGRDVSSGWTPGCDGRSVDEAINRLGFASREDFISWAATFARTAK